MRERCGISGEVASGILSNKKKGSKKKGPEERRMLGHSIVVLARDYYHAFSCSVFEIGGDFPSLVGDGYAMLIAGIPFTGFYGCETLMWINIC